MLFIPRFLQVIGLVPALVIFPYINNQEWGILLLIIGLVFSYIVHAEHQGNGENYVRRYADTEKYG